MNRKLVFTLSFVFLVSTGLNVYLYIKARRFEEAWVEQIMTTSDIEGIFKASTTDPSFDSVRRLAIARFGSDNVKIVEVADRQIEWGADKKGLKVNDTLLLFKDGLYYGSKANLPLD